VAQAPAEKIYGAVFEFSHRYHHRTHTAFYFPWLTRRSMLSTIAGRIQFDVAAAGGVRRDLDQLPAGTFLSNQMRARDLLEKNELTAACALR